MTGAAPALRLTRRFGRDRRGATGIEYALILAGIAIAILATVFALGGEVNNLFGYVEVMVDECVGSGTASDQGLQHGKGKGCGQR